MLRRWYERAEREVPLAEAVCLATVDADGHPDARMVLLKGFGPEGFRFFTNEGSAKGAQLEAAPGAALVVFWRELDRQVRVRGPVERVGADEADEYFASRGRARARSAPGRARRAARWPPATSSTGSVEEVEERFGGPTRSSGPRTGAATASSRSRSSSGRARSRRLHDRFRYSRERLRRALVGCTRLAP